MGGDTRRQAQTGQKETGMDKLGTGWSQKATAKDPRRRAVVEGGGSGTREDKQRQNGAGQQKTGRDRTGKTGAEIARSGQAEDRLETEGDRQGLYGQEPVPDRRRQRKTSTRGRGSLTHLGNFLNLPPGALGREGVGTAAEDLVLVLH
jgi:hypothetical protein